MLSKETTINIPDQRKVALMGTSCVGKTSIFESLKTDHREDPRFAFVEEAARIFFTNNPDVTDRFSAESQGKVQMIALESEKSAHEAGAKLIVCDRSVLDAVVYTKAHGDRKGAEELLKRVEFWLPTYYRFLLLDPTDVPYQTDAVRQESQEVRMGFHNAFIDFFNETGIPYELVEGTLEERLGRVNHILTI